MPKKRFSINLSKGKTKFCLSFPYNTGNSYLFVSVNCFFKFKADLSLENYL